MEAPAWHPRIATAGTCWDGSLDLDFGGLGRGDKSVLMVLQVCDCGWMGLCVRHSISHFLHISSCSFFFFLIQQSDTSTDGNTTSKLKQHTWIWWWGVTKATSMSAFWPFLVPAVSIIKKKNGLLSIFSKEGRHLYNWYMQRKLFRLINSTYR